MINFKKNIVSPVPCIFLTKFFQNTIVIPPYQRFYAWNRELIEQLVADIEVCIKDKRTLYLGTLLTKDYKNKQVYIVDGQQRIITIIILLRCLLRSGKLDDDNKRDIKQWFSKTTFQRLDIDLNETQRNEFFKAVIWNGDNIDVYTSEHRTLSENVVLAIETFDELFTGMTKKQINQIYNFIFQGVEFVIIELSHTAEESDIFEAINSKRVELSSADLIKNYLLSETPQSKQIEALKLWNEFYNYFSKNSERENFIEYFCFAESKKEDNFNRQNHTPFLKMNA